jgi:hypothetical protein
LEAKFRRVLQNSASDPALLGRVFSTGPEGRCDDFRVGGAVVDHDPVSGLWRMWYYCRDAAMAGPPALGSGRVALATSRDGIGWDRVDGPEERGSVLAPGTAANDFDSLHVGLTDVSRGAGEWLMWYFGGNHQQRTSTKPVIGTQAGLGMRPGLARSADGIHWRRVRGRATGGALIDLARDELYASWPNVFWDGRRFIMQLTAPTIDMARFGTTVFASGDALDWEPLGQITWADGPRSWDESGLVTRQVLANPLPGGRRWLMVYTGLDAAQSRSIAIADSDDGIQWHHVGDGPVFRPGAPGSWDEFGVAANRLVAAEGRLHLYYYGFQALGGEGLRGIGLATAPIDDIAALRRHRS